MFYQSLVAKFFKRLQLKTSCSDKSCEEPNKTNSSYHKQKYAIRSPRLVDIQNIKSLSVSNLFVLSHICLARMSPTGRWVLGRVAGYDGKGFIVYTERVYLYISP